MYSYPIDYEIYSKEEIIRIVEFLDLIVEANEKKVNDSKLIAKYKEYQKIINAKSTLKKIDKDFESITGYSIYKTMKKITLQKEV